jgi:methionyl-tRNA formyltransferase
MKKEKMLNVAVITQGVSPIVRPIFDHEDVNVCAIIESAPRKEPRHPKLWRFLRRVYNPDNALDRFAHERDIPYFWLTRHNQGAVSDALEALPQKLDVIIVYSMAQLLKPEIFNMPHLGTLNLHTSVLPLHRGANPLFWMYYDMDKKGGSTLHFIDAGEDTGNIVNHYMRDVPLGISSPDFLRDIVAAGGVAMIMDAIDTLLEQGYLNAEKQSDIVLPRNIVGAYSEGFSRRARRLSPQEHRVVIDWGVWPIERIYHLMRGTELWLDVLPPLRGIWRYERWSIQGYLKHDDPQAANFVNAEYGEPFKVDGQWAASARDGVILLSRYWSLKRFLLGVIRDMIRLILK